MFPDLNSLTNFSEKSPPKRKFVLISDCQNDGSFLIHHFLTMYIKGGFKVFFVALVQSFSHYNNVAQKLVSINLFICHLFIYLFNINFFPLLITLLSINLLPVRVNVDTGIFVFVCRGQTFTLQPLCNRIKSSLGKETKPCLLLIDDLTALLSIGIHVQDVINFIHYCSTLMCYSPSMVHVNILTLVHNDNDVDDEESLLLWKQLCYVAHMELHVRGLNSGYCKDVHGQLTITSRDQNKVKHSSKVVQYKIHDKTVTCFAPGLSKAVL
ncbi:elongator complex protein 6-like [Orbicella faveolata]|uniref:elongator complex protein 6-like n=1 Tax=Orbicella faveolata TaxID=48498 RepID=UPI0009E2C87E|nr:elongator complex protein 6-like [Orbicella faveolata]